jgi:hypothetical protein
MSDGKGQAVGERELKVEVLIELGHRTPAWQELMRRLLAPSPCKGERLPLDFRQKDEGEGHA